MPYNMTSSTKAMSSEQTQAALRELLEGPAMSPPAGVISNFHDPPNLGALVTMTVTLCMGSGTLALVLRLYTKAFILRVLKWEDYVIVLAWVKWPRKVDRSGTEIRSYSTSERLSCLYIRHDLAQEPTCGIFNCKHSSVRFIGLTSHLSSTAL